MDSGCTENVASYPWMEEYIDALPEELKKEVCRRRCPGVKFMFGAGDTQISNEVVTFPGEIAGISCTFSTHLVPNSVVPFLWSRKSMGKAKVLMDLEKEEIVVLGKRIVPDVTSAGHMCINIRPRRGKGDEICEEVLATSKIAKKS